MNALSKYDFKFIDRKNGCVLIFSNNKSSLIKLFNFFIAEYSHINTIYVIESNERINLYELAKLLRWQQRQNIAAHFRNIFYARPISLYQLSMIIEDSNPYSPILIPNFLLPFEEEGLSDIEKSQQLQVLKAQLKTESIMRPIIIGVTKKEYETYAWVFEILEDIFVKTFTFNEDEVWDSKGKGIQLNLF